MKKKTKTNNTEVEIKKQIKFGSALDFSAREAYNLLRTNLMFSFPDNNTEKGKIVGVTSSVPREGKSYTSINLACSLAEAGHKVILVDCDLRRPSIASTLDKPSSPGLSNMLTGTDKGSIYKNLLGENGDVLMSGDIPPNPSELLGSQKMKETLDIFSEIYDYIIVDLPPITSVSDPLIMSKYVDGYVLVVRHGYTSKKDVDETIRQLRFINAKILGFVYNDYHSPNSGYYKKNGKYKRYYKYYSSDKYGSGYGYGYGYGYQSRKPEAKEADAQKKQ